jgi:POT family proton-dependent oligopeptide transporter
MTSTGPIDNDAIARSGLVDPEAHGIPQVAAKGSMDVTRRSVSDSDDELPTEEELQTLRRVSGKIKWAMYTIAFVEACERFSYYGSAVLYTNFVAQKLPPGSNTGAPLDPDGQAGALGMGPKAAQGISLFNQFFAYLMPLVGYVTSHRISSLEFH